MRNKKSDENNAPLKRGRPNVKNYKYESVKTFRISLEKKLQLKALCSILNKNQTEVILRALDILYEKMFSKIAKTKKIIAMGNRKSIENKLKNDYKELDHIDKKIRDITDDCR